MQSMHAFRRIHCACRIMYASKNVSAHRHLRFPCVPSSLFTSPPNFPPSASPFFCRRPYCCTLRWRTYALPRRNAHAKRIAHTRRKTETETETLPDRPLRPCRIHPLHFPRPHPRLCPRLQRRASEPLQMRCCGPRLCMHAEASYGRKHNQIHRNTSPHRHPATKKTSRW